MKELGFNNRRELEIFMENVVFLRKAHGYSKKKMAELLCISVGTLNKIEKGVMPEQLGVSTLFEIYDKFNVLPSKMFTHYSNWEF